MYIFICNYYLLFVRHFVLYIRFGEINILYLDDFKFGLHGLYKNISAL